MRRIDYYRAGQGPATLLVPHNQAVHAYVELWCDPAVTNVRIIL